MADSKTWIDVADTAVKIGLGALIGGLIGVWLARINNRHSTTTNNKENKMRILEEVLELTDSFSQSVTTFWANRINAAWKVKKGEKLKIEEKEKLSTQERKLFNGFTIINTCRSKLLLIGAKEAEQKLSEYREPIDEFFKISAIDNKDCTYEKLLPFKEKISKSRRAFYEILNSEYEK